MAFDSEKFWSNWEQTTQNKLASLSVAELEAFYDYFAESHFRAHAVQPERMRAASDRVLLLRSELDRRYGDTQHKQAIDLGENTLTWAKVAGIAAIVAVLVAAISLVLQIFPSKTPLSIPEAASPAPSPQPTATISESQEPAATSNSATPSPTSSVESTPTESASIPP